MSDLEEILEDPTITKLEEQGKKILEGHGDVTLVNDEVNQIWNLEVTELTKPLRAVIVQHLRENRKLYAQAKTKKAAKKTKVPVPEGGIELGDLELDLNLE